MAKQAWKDNAACLGAEASLFFLGRGGSPKRAREQFCDICPVRQACRDYAILYREEGIWGGMTDDERKAIEPVVGPMLRKRALKEGQLEERKFEVEPQLPAVVLENPSLVSGLLTDPDHAWLQGPTEEQLAALEREAEATFLATLTLQSSNLIPDQRGVEHDTHHYSNLRCAG